MTELLRRVKPDEIDRAVRPPVDEATLEAAGAIVADVRTNGADAVRKYAEQFGEREPGDVLVLGHIEMAAALTRIDDEDRMALERAASRIESFARAQRESILELSVPIPGGKAGHTVEPVRSAGCYAPGGRYPLPSSVLMTAIAARSAGCERVVVASPNTSDVMLAAAAIAGADEFLAVGGAHAVAAMAYGFEDGNSKFERVDVIAGPGNRFVTAAKQLVSGVVGIDMLAGPSELLVLADGSADPAVVAADLLAQAEHDADASAMLVTTDGGLADSVQAELEKQLAELATRDVAERALKNGFVCLCGSLDEAIAVTDRIAPEHLEILTTDAEVVAGRVRNAGACFIGARTAEVVGDYGAGPNHTLPTGGTARFRAGLSVMDFLRLRTWIRLDDDSEVGGALLADTVRLAELEGLAGHAASARARLGSDVRCR
jgi:histidinol dehydrogenase